MTADLFKRISPQLAENEPMSRHTTFRIGGAADMFVSIESKEEISELIKTAKKTGTPFMVMGNGSNMLVGDNGIRGLVIQIGAGFSDCVIDGCVVTAQAGILMSRLAANIAKAELTGFEPLSGIPGTLGGGVFMNAGAYGGELSALIRNVTYVDDNGDIYTIDNKSCEFGYRTSIFSAGGKYILSAQLELEKGSAETIKAASMEYSRRRSDKQPLNFPSAGSTFKRPNGHFAGKLIQDAGLMGYSIGGAEVSDKHAGFVINKGGATAADVLALIKHIQDTVYKQSGVMLEPEVRLIGE